MFNDSMWILLQIYIVANFIDIYQERRLRGLVTENLVMDCVYKIQAAKHVEGYCIIGLLVNLVIDLMI